MRQYYAVCPKCRVKWISIVENKMVLCCGQWLRLDMKEQKTKRRKNRLKTNIVGGF